jgi:hypothetical protein
MSLVFGQHPPRDLEHPRPLPSPFFVALETSDDAEKDLLAQVFGLVSGAREPVQIAPDRHPVPHVDRRGSLSEQHDASV